MARRVGHARFVRPAPRTKIWIGSGVGEDTLTASTIVLISTLSVGALALRPFTILRTRMNILYSTDQLTASEQPFGTYGKIVVTDSATSAGIGSIPSPSGISPGDPEASWFVNQAMASRILRGAAGMDASVGNQYEIDSKSMRKVGPDDDVATVFTQDAAVGAGIVTSGRMLIQLH